MYERHVRRSSQETCSPCSRNFSRKKLNYQELSQGQLKEINSCDEKNLETPHTHAEEFQTLKTM